MNSSALLAPPSAPNRPLLRSPFLNPIPLRSTTTTTTSSSVHFQRRCFRVSVPRNSSTPSAAAVPPPSSSPRDVFGGKKELKGIQPLVEKLSPPLRLASSAIVFAGAVAAGYGLGFRFGNSQNAALGGAVALGAAGGAAAYALNACVPEVAAVELHNYVAGSDDPRAVRKEDIEGIAKKSVLVFSISLN